MAIGFLSRNRLCLKVTGLIALAFLLLPVRSFADDQIKKKDGSVMSGQVLGVSDGQVMFQSRTPSGGVVKLPVYLTDIQSVTMAPPADFAKVKGAEPAAVISALEPLVKQFAGLPSDWVLDA